MVQKVLDSATYSTVMGRHVVSKEDGSITFDWPGVQLFFSQVTATTSIGIRIPKLSSSVLGYSVKEHDDTEGRMDEAKIISRQFFSREYPLATGLDINKTYNVSIWKRDDPALVKIDGLIVDENATASSSGDERNKLFIEFVGDSDTVGFGNEGSFSGVIQHILLESWFSQRTRRKTNAYKSWARHVADAFNAQFSIIAWSGLGAKHSPFGSNNNMIKVYPRVLATRKKTSANDLGPVHVVLIYIGQNDQTALKDDSCGGQRGLESKLSRAFEELVLLIRQHRCHVPIIAVVPAQDCVVACAMSKGERSHTCTTQSRVWKGVMERLGGPRKGYHVVDNQHEPQIGFNSRHDFGMCLHWNAASNQKFAHGLIPKIRDLIKER